MTTVNRAYVLDTNVLIADPHAIYKFEEHDVLIPMTVLEELDNIKSSSRDISRDARVAIRTIEGLIEQGCFEKGVSIGEGQGSLKVVTALDNARDLDLSVNDNKIIATAMAVESSTKYTETILVSNDINMRVKSSACGMNSQPFKSEEVIDDVRFLTKGYTYVERDWYTTLQASPECKGKSCGSLEVPAYLMPEGTNPNTCINTWIINEEDDIVAKVIDVTEDINSNLVYTLSFKNAGQLMSRRVAGIKGRTLPQAIALDMMMDRDLDVVIAFGDAGSGKTLLAVAAACGMIKGKKNYPQEELIFGKSEDHQFKDIGFLPGNEHEKMAPWAGAIYDNLEVVARDSKDYEFHPDMSIEGDNAFIKLKSLNFMRGRSLNNRVVIIDEGQNLNPSQMKTLLTRAGSDCKVIILGNLAQIDNAYLSANNSGLTYITEKFSRWHRAGIVHLESIERSELAAFVTENF